MALNTVKCDHLTSLGLKGLISRGRVICLEQSVRSTDAVLFFQQSNPTRMHSR